jgi:RNA polymerase sigma-70 factor (ECF subfamily)
MEHAETDYDDDVDTLLRRGERTSALRLLMQRHGDEVYQVCRRLLRDTSLAEDVRQQVFFEAYRDLSQFQGRSSFRTWLLSIARHRALDALKSRSRRASREVELAEVDEPSDPRPSAIESLDDKQLRRQLESMLGALGDSARSAVVLRFQRGLTFEEMSAVCGEDSAVLRNRVSRALRRLRAAIESCAGTSIAA